MASDPRSIRLDGDLERRFDKFIDENDFNNEGEAHRQALDEGLRSLGYEPGMDTRAGRWLGLTRGIGSVLGVAALILLGIGTFLGPGFSRYGFGLAVASIAFLAGAEIAERHGTAIVQYLEEKAHAEAQQWVPEDYDGPEEGS